MNTPVVIGKSDLLKTEVLIDSEAKKAIVRPIGIINELASFDSLLEYLTKIYSDVSCFRFDLEKVSSMNSSGAREWLLFIEKIEKLRPIETEKASEVMVELAGLVPNTFGKSNKSILSFFAPYYCPKCDRRHLELLVANSVKWDNDNTQAPELSCPACNSQLEYFVFLRNN